MKNVFGKRFEEDTLRPQEAMRKCNMKLSTNIPWEVGVQLSASKWAECQEVETETPPGSGHDH